jgi:asparagine synthetase B (glutamine-hydrolysing)
VWGTPIPQEGQDVFNEFERACGGDYSRLKYLAGSWIAVVYSISTRQLRLINDCFGTRPVFYYREIHSRRFSFASDVSHLKDIGTLDSAVNPDVLASWIWYGYNIATTGILADAKHMDAGSVLVVDSTGRSEQSPYVTQQDATHVNSREDLIDRFEAVIGWACHTR